MNLLLTGLLRGFPRTTVGGIYARMPIEFNRILLTQ
jgi:hypothetical protein